MGKSLVHPIANGPIVIKRCKDVLDSIEDLIDAIDIEIGLLLPGKRRIGQILRGSR